MTDDLKALLEARRSQLEGELASLTRPAADRGAISFGKRVGDGTSLAVERLSQVAVHDKLQEMLSTVARAEAKVYDGTYGKCDRCDGPIGPERLEALPWSTHCRACAGKS